MITYKKFPNYKQSLLIIMFIILNLESKEKCLKRGNSSSHIFVVRQSRIIFLLICRQIKFYNCIDYFIQNRESGKSKPMGETPENANNDESSAIAPADEAILSVQIPSFGESENGANDCLQQTETHSPPPSEQDQPSTSVAAEQIQSIGEHNSNVDESPESECLTNAINGQRQNSVENDTLQNASNVRQEAEVLESDSVAAAGAKLPFYFNVLQTIKDELERRLKAQNGPAQMNSSLSQLSASNGW